MAVNTLHIQWILTGLKGFHNFVSMPLFHPILSHLNYLVNVFNAFLEKVWAEATFSSFTAGVCLPCSLFPLLFPLLLKGFLELVFPLVCCSLRVSSSFFFVCFFFCFILPFNCRGVVVCFSFSFCNRGVSVKSVLLFSGISVWPWQLLEIEPSHRAAARATGNVLLSTSTTRSANPLRCFHGQKKESRSTARRGFFLIYTSICIWTALSPVTQHNGFWIFEVMSYN